MKTLLVINTGSSSLKFGVFQGEHEVLSGLIDDLGARARFVLQVGRKKIERRVVARDVRTAMNTVRSTLVTYNLQPSAIAHRIVHGGGIYWQPTKLTSNIVQHLRHITELAPLHMPLNLAGVAAAIKLWPRVEQYGVFDTAAFHDLPQTVQWYPLPLSISKKFHIRKYGFHGISHHWALEQAAKKLKRPISRVSAVTIHLGAGDSITLWDHGRPLDTSMGFTPLEGLTMSTRSGDIDPSIPLFLVEHGKSAKQVEDLLEKRSGLFGLTGLTDMRDILGAAGHPVAGWLKQRWTAKQRTNAKFAVAMFIHNIQRYLASYLGQLERCDAIVFTGSVGQNTFIQRQVLKLPAARRIRHITIPTNEERAIATAVQRVLH